MIEKFVLCRSDAGDGGWSLHAPGSTDEDIATGEAPPLVTGGAAWLDDRWSRPSAADYAVALSVYEWLAARRALAEAVTPLDQLPKPKPTGSVV